MGFAIDTDVPLPKRKGRQALAATIDYPFAMMRLGADPARLESWFHACEYKSHNRVSVAASEFSRLHPPFKFATRWFDKDPKYGVPGVRVWRVA